MVPFSFIYLDWPLTTLFCCAFLVAFPVFGTCEARYIKFGTYVEYGKS